MLYKHNAGVLPTYIRYQSGVEKVTSFNFFFFDWVPGFEGQDTGKSEGLLAKKLLFSK
jgi:hypothetical protein